jgi:hypothetical protein
MSLTKASYSMINGAPVSVLDFGADPTGVADSTSAITAARNFVAAATDKYKLVFPAGTYKYSVSPNFGVTNMCVEAQGEVLLNYTGTGNCLIFDAGVAPALVYNMRFTGNFTVQGTSASANGIYWRSVHHSKIDCRVSGCGPTASGLLIEFAVCSEFNVVVSYNETPFTTNRPLYGYYLYRRDVGETTSACTFYNPIIEGVGSHGILLSEAVYNTFIGGTSEGNGAYGIYVLAGSRNNSFYGIDLEANVKSLYDEGGLNNYIGGLYANPTEISGTGISFVGAQLGTLTNSGTLYLNNVSYDGTITNTGKITKQNVYYQTGATFDTDLKINSFEKQLSVASGVATTLITLPSTGNFFYNVYAYYVNGGPASAYGAWAVINKAADGTAHIYTQQNGSGMSISLSGLNIQVTQTSGASILVKAVAQVM